jgi:hypothetical protein
MKKQLKAALVGGAAAAAIAATVGVAAPAQASSHHVVTEVFWSGQSCIRIWDGLSGSLRTRCGGNAVFEEYRTSGDIGLDPEMSGADWIGCNIRIDGYIVHSDSTTRGSGHEVTCVYTL